MRKHITGILVAFFLFPALFSPRVHAGKTAITAKICFRNTENLGLASCFTELRTQGILCRSQTLSKDIFKLAVRYPSFQPWIVEGGSVKCVCTELSTKYPEELAHNPWINEY